MSGLEKQVEHTIERHGLIKPGDDIIVGVSGGPDSTALLNVLVRLNGRPGWGCNIHVAHLNHMLRGRESQADEDFVRDVARSHGLECTIKKADVGEWSERNKCSVETAARRLRYTFFEELAQKISATRVAVGHTADDNAETVLYRIIRGTGLLGLGGIRPLRTLSPDTPATLIRPLLYSWRWEILRYLRESGLEYRTDSSNLRPDNFRNRIRLELLPLLEKQYNPQIKDALTRLGDIAGRSNDFLQSRIGRIVEANLKESGGGIYSFEADLLKHHPPFFQHFFLKEVLGRAGMPLNKMDYEHYNGLIEMIETDTGRKHIELPARWTAYIDGKKLCLRKTTAAPTYTPAFGTVELTVPGVTELPDGRRIRAEIISVTAENGFLEKFKGEKTPHEEVLDADKVEGKLYVRTRREGDRFRPLGTAGEKKLKDFFIDTKTPRWKRDTILIIASDSHPVWVTGLRIDDRVKITPDTKRALKLSLH